MAEFFVSYNEADKDLGRVARLGFPTFRWPDAMSYTQMYEDETS